MKYCEEIIKRIKELRLESPLTTAFHLRKIIFEYESFIFQCRALFDHFIHSITYYFGFFTLSHRNLMKKLEELSSKKEKAKKVYGIFNKMPNFDRFLSRSRVYPNGYSPRDKIAHIGQIRLFPLNIMFNPAKGAKILPYAEHDTSRDVFNQPNLTDSLSPFMWNLFEFISKVYETIFE